MSSLQQKRSGTGLTVRCYTLFEIVKDAQRLARGKQYTYEGLESGALKPLIDRTFTLNAIVDAHRFMESNQQKGKIVVTVLSPSHSQTRGITMTDRRTGQARFCPEPGSFRNGTDSVRSRLVQGQSLYVGR